MTDAPLVDPPAYGTADDAAAATPAAPSPGQPSTGPTDPARNLALLGILALVLGAWMIVPMTLIEEGSRLDFGFTQSNVIYLVANTGIGATILLAAGAVTLGSRGLLTAATVVGGLNLVVQLGIFVVQLVEDARPELAYATLGACGILAMVAAALAVGWKGLRGPTSARVVALVVVLAAALWHSSMPYLLSDHFANLPLIAVVYSLVSAVAGIAAVCLLGLPNVRTRWVAVGLLAYFVLGGLFGLPQLGRFVPDAMHFVVTQVLSLVLEAVALVLAILAARRSR